MHKIKYLLIGIMMFLSGCSIAPKAYHGGESSFVTEKETTANIKPVEPVKPNITGNEVIDKVNQELYSQKLEHFNNNKDNELTSTVKEKTEITVRQPDNAKTPAELNITQDPNGYLTMGANTGNSHNIADLAAINAKFKSLNPLIIMGAVLMIIGVLAGWLTHNVKLGLLIGGTGVCMIILSVLLAEYAIYFLILAAIIAIGAGWYFLRNLGLNAKANIENIAVIEALRKDLPENLENKWFKESHASAKIIQSPSTIKLVKQIKEEQKI